MAFCYRQLRFGNFALGLSVCLALLAWCAKGELVLSNYSSSHPLKIMAVGDSITDDCEHNGAWRQYLQPLLETNGYPFTFVGRLASAPSPGFTKTRHEGYCGSVIAPPGVLNYTVNGYPGPDVYLLKIVADALTNAKPDLVLVVMGANDIGRARDPYRVATNDMPKLVDLIFSNVPSANIIITKTTSLSNAVFGYMTNFANVPIYNAALQTMVNERRAQGQNLFLADMFSAVDYNTMFGSDHLHPNPTGLKAMANEFFTRIQAITIRTNSVTSTLIHGGSDWKYFDTGQEPASDWTQTDYDDSAWKEGPARLGYGDRVVATTVSFGSDATNKYPAMYFRRRFVVPEGIAFTNLNFRLTRIDGAVVWLNGQEAFRTNMPTGAIAFTNLASSRVTGERAYIFYPTNIATSLLPVGTNAVAVEVHLGSPTNTLAGFDLELIAAGYVIPPPSLSATVAGGNLALSWPVMSGSGYSLYSSTNLSPSGAWDPSLDATETNNGMIMVTLPVEPAPKFFRLQKP